MALKKSELYSSLWASCDELRGGMDASQYKDYVLVLPFVKYVSDRYADEPYAPISIPKGASFADMVALKGKSDIGDQINKKILGPLAQANKLSDMPDFNDPNKLGSGKEMVERLTNLIAIFENPALDFSKNRADGDDLLGDAYDSVLARSITSSTASGALSIGLQRIAGGECRPGAIARRKCPSAFGRLEGVRNTMDH
jgi:type I restriction enzyme M protein